MSNENKVNATGQYHDVQFVIDPYWQFHVPSLQRTYDTYRQMTEAIDRVADTEKAAKKKKVALECFTSKGTSVTITGVHSGNGNLTTKPVVDRFDRDEFYPNVEWIADALKQIRQLKKQAEHIRDAIGDFKIYYHAPYPFYEGSHLKQVESIEADYGGKKKAAEKTNLEKQLKDTPIPKDIEL